MEWSRKNESAPRWVKGSWKLLKWGSAKVETFRDAAAFCGVQNRIFFKIQSWTLKSAWFFSSCALTEAEGSQQLRSLTCGRTTDSSEHLSPAFSPNDPNSRSQLSKLRVVRKTFISTRKGTRSGNWGPIRQISSLFCREKHT